MKKWNTPEVEAVEINATAFGPSNDKVPDLEKEAVLDDNGNVIGWRARFGEASK